MNFMINHSSVRFTPAELEHKRGIWDFDKRLDSYEITNPQVAENSMSTVAIWEKEDVINLGNGFMELRVKSFKDTFNLDSSERFSTQPVCAGFSCTGVLVAKNIIATAAHFVNEFNLRRFCFHFGYIMRDPDTPVTRILAKDVYYGREIIHHNITTRENDFSGSDWVLIKLDRNVEGQHIARLSRRPLFSEQSVYSLGFPCGTPLKCAPSGLIEQIENESFTTKLDLFSGTSGSPVFCSETHDLIGIVSACDVLDFKWQGDHRISMVYRSEENESRGSRCTQASAFNSFIH